MLICDVRRGKGRSVERSSTFHSCLPPFDTGLFWPNHLAPPRYLRFERGLLRSHRRPVFRSRVR